MLKKFLQTFIITYAAIVITLTPVISMIEAEDIEPHEKWGLLQNRKNVEDIEGNKHTVHWGLSHWISGIGEYFERCLCCGIAPKTDGVYIHNVTRNGHTSSYSSDCFLVDPDTGWCDNPITGTLYCPLVTMFHLCCLPIVACYCRDEDHWVLVNKRH
ncbi:MAG: hypothetical protein K2X02_09870 [Alphaproteobacteria bacterium]|nr:hypothetical protein [Alphaproteobacteria bacterium]